MHTTNPLIHTFGGQHFEVVVWQAGAHGTYEAIIRKRPDSRVTVHKGCIACSSEHLRELEHFSKLAELMIEHLSRGKPFACWTLQPSNN